MGTFCETGRDAADAECKARCGAMVFWDSNGSIMEVLEGQIQTFL